ncbi:MAG: sirohydrochlorin cobaltochelatase [Phycisphaerae bacterium]|nr:sirohydrochlorin cobaltochelatase [Phycisphaerae bacterium]
MKRAIIVVDHGSRLDEANAMLDAFAGMLRGMTGDAVYPAHMELAAPTIAEAFDAAVADGAEFVFVFPYFLSPGRHSRKDIPRMCADAAARHPDIHWHCSGPIGLDRGVAELVLRRIDQCEANAYTCDSCPDRTKCQ